MSNDLNDPFEWSAAEEYQRGKYKAGLEELLYRDRYAARLIVRGLSEAFARACAASAEIVADVGPEEAADDDLSYMQEDSQ